MGAMRLIAEHVGDAARRIAAEPPPGGPGWPPEVVARVDRLKVWGTTFDEPGPDFCEFRGFQGNVLVASRRLDGY